MIMKKILILLTLLSFSLSVYAEVPQSKVNNYPQGTFKKNRSGQIIQYDNKGKKIGVYKASKRYIKVK